MSRKTRNQRSKKTGQVLVDFSLFSQFGEAMLKALKDINCRVS